MDYTEEEFLAVFNEALHNNNLRELLSLVRRLCYDRKNGIRRINYIQDCLYEKKIIPFKVHEEQDYLKIDEFVGDDVISWLLEYFCEANTSLKELRNEVY